jgi:hypothetical protein
MAEGDIVCDAEGSETHIKANKIRVYAREVLELIGDEMVRIQAGKEGGGPVMIYGGSVTTVTNNLEEIISGQRMTFGVSEETTVSFDPRANASIVSAGHVNRYIAGDYLHTVAGVAKYTYGGGVLSVPFIKDRTNALSITTLALPINIDAKTLLTLKGGAAIDIDAGAAITANAVGGIYLDAQGEFSAKAKAKTTISGISGSLEFSGIDFILKNLAGATVKSVGPIIHLN